MQSVAVRTMIIDPDEEQKVLYKLILQVFDTLVSNLKIGTKISEVFNEAYAKIVSEKGEEWA